MYYGPINPKSPQYRKLKALVNRFTNELVARKTGLTRRQVEYAKEKFGLTRPLRFAQGRTPEAQTILARLDEMIGECKELRRRCRDIVRNR